jgi:spermidine/putrescine transport system ATP-binding protein
MNKGDVLQVGSPHEIYESPATNFVANFIGETNLFDGIITNVESFDRGEEHEVMCTLDVPVFGKIKVTTVDEVKAGDKVSWTIRPEKIIISKEKPESLRGDINVLRGIVNEPIYSGFQTKYYIKTDTDGVAADAEDAVSDKTSPLIRVIKQHAVYSDEGPDIVWKDIVYVRWSAVDSYIVEINDESGERGNSVKAETNGGAL